MFNLRVFFLDFDLGCFVDMHVAAWESIFTTDFISADENESLKIANIDGLIGQV